MSNETKHQIERDEDKQTIIAIVLLVIGAVLLVTFLVGQSSKHSRSRAPGACQELFVDFQNAAGELANKTKYEDNAMIAYDTAEVTQLRRDYIDILDNMGEVLARARGVGCLNKDEWFREGKQWMR